MRTKSFRKLGVYAGSFDPVTVGHLWMVEQGVALFDHLVVVKGLVGPKGWKRVVRKYVPEPVYRHLIKARA